MLGRTLGSAAWAIALGLAAALPAQAQNLEAGKSPAQIFNGACAVCHKSPRGLVKSVPPPSLPGFLRQHYTTSSDMAGMLSGYLLANGAVAVDRRPAADKPRRGRDARPAVAPEPAPAAAATPGWWPFRSPPAQSAGGDGRATPGHEAEQRPARKPPAKRRAHRKDENKAKDEEHHNAAPAASEAAPLAAKPDAPPASKAEADHKPVAGTDSSGGGEGASSRRDPVPAVTPAPHAAEPKAD